VVDPAGHGRYRIVADGQQRITYAVADRERTWVFIAGRTYVIEGRDREGRSGRVRTDDQLALSAPMPATVLAVNVTPGQAVEEGDLLIMLEAMKMELPIKAPRAGRVKSIGFREGELVQPGVPLLELE
jgi:acetyl-CoA/propionyl-CoA carboxylase biotin carboxyl carrier protein